MDVHIWALWIHNVGIASEGLVVIGLLHVRHGVLSDLRPIYLQFSIVFVSDFIHLVLKGHLAGVHVHVVEGGFLVDVVWYLMAVVLLFESSNTWHLASNVAHYSIVTHIALHGRVVVNIGFRNLSDCHLLLVLVQSHLLVYPVLDLSSLLDLDDTWSISWIDQGHLIISVHFVQLTDLYQIIDDFATI